MRWFIIALFAAVSAVAQEGPPDPPSPTGVQYERVYSSNVVEKAWRRDVVGVRNGQLDDPTGTLASKADIDFLSAVESGISQIHQAGTNGFNIAKTNFLATVSNHPPQNATMVALVFRPYASLRPEDKNIYGFLASETNGVLKWFFSRPFLMKPNMIAQDAYLDGNGNTVVSYSKVDFVDYFTDATNSPAPHAEGSWDRIIRATEPASPVTGAIINRSHHLHFGHPDTGFNVGSLNIGVRQPGSQDVKYGVTGTFTDTVNRIEFVISKGALNSAKGY